MVIWKEQIASVVEADPTGGDGNLDVQGKHLSLFCVYDGTKN